MPKADGTCETRLLATIEEKGSFDLSAFFARLEAVPDWGKIVVAHIYLDHILTETLRDVLPNAELYFQGHKSFSDKLNLCQSHGCFAGEFGRVLAGINTSRNRFAHKLVFDVSDAEKTNLFRLLSESRPVSAVTEEGGFESFLIDVVVYAEYERIAFAKLQDLDRQKSHLMKEAMELLSVELRGPGIRK